MLDLRQHLPRATFETCFSGEAFFDSVYCSLCEFVSSEGERTSSLSLLLQEIKDRDIALMVPLNDSGFLILLHSSHFVRHDDIESSSTEVLQGVFVFSGSRVARGIKFSKDLSPLSSEVLRVLPVLNYAEAEVEKTTSDPSEELCEVYAHHMQSYAALINPGLASSPSRDFSIFPDQYDVPDEHKHLYSAPEWTKRAWQNLTSYLSKPVSFQLPVSKASEILAAGQEERMEDLDEDVYFCLSSPENSQVNDDSMEAEDLSTGRKSEDNCTAHTEAQVDSAAASLRTVLSDNSQPTLDTTKDYEKTDPTVPVKAQDEGSDSLLTPPPSNDLPAELIVSITSAEQTVTDGNLSRIDSESQEKHIDLQPSAFSLDKSEPAEVSSLHKETPKSNIGLDCPELRNLTKIQCRKPLKKRTRCRIPVPEASHTIVTQVEVDKSQELARPPESVTQEDKQASESSGHQEVTKPSNIDWRKGRRRKRVFGKLSPRNKKVRYAVVVPKVAEEKKTHLGPQSSEKELEICHVRKKSLRWDLRPVTSECGRILVPHGSTDFADQIKTFKDRLEVVKNESCPNDVQESSVKTPETVEMEPVSSSAPETALYETEATTSVDSPLEVAGNHLEDYIANHSGPEGSILKESDDGHDAFSLYSKSFDHSSEGDRTNTPPSESVEEKQREKPSPGKGITKGHFLFDKLKSVLLKGKRKAASLMWQQTTDTAEDTEPCLKQAKADIDSEIPMGDNGITDTQDISVKEVSKMLSVDPLFAYALGLTPKDTSGMTRWPEGQDSQESMSSETQGRTILDNPFERSSVFFSKRTRIKTLKKHHSVSAENVKKKWWLHFQGSFANEKQKNVEGSSGDSASKTVKEKSQSATAQSTDALTLLAELALCGTNDKGPPQPKSTLEGKPERSLKKCDFTKDVASSAKESVLHALLRQPAARPMQPLKSASPSLLVGGGKVAPLIAKEHAYSLSPSSPVLLDLSGSSFQVSPISGSTKLLHHYQTMDDSGTKTLHPFVHMEDRSEHRTQESLKKQVLHRRKFRHSRTFVDKDGPIQVTRHWTENYDFKRDSKFTSGSKDKTIIRALHGPWDHSIQDTSEEVQLIVHMWIGLFYSRSTPRFFHFDADLPKLCSEENEIMGTTTDIAPPPAQSELMASSFDSLDLDASASLISKALDLSKKDLDPVMDKGSVLDPVMDEGSVLDPVMDEGSVLDPVMDEGSVLDPVMDEGSVLDLSLRNSAAAAEVIRSDEQGNEKETPVLDEQKKVKEAPTALKSSIMLEKPVRKCVFESERMYSPLSNAAQLEHPDVQGGGTFVSSQETESVALKWENHQKNSRTAYERKRCSNEKMDIKDEPENSETDEMNLKRQDSSKCMDKDDDSITKAGDDDDDLASDPKCDNTESKQVEQCEVKEKSHREVGENSSPNITVADDDSTSREEPTIVCNENPLGNEKDLSLEKLKTSSLDEAADVKDVNCCPEAENEGVSDDRLTKEDMFHVKDSCVSVNSALSDMSLPLIGHDPDSQKDAECNRDGSLDDPAAQAVNKDSACHGQQLKKLAKNGIVLRDGCAISETAPHGPSDMEIVENEATVQPQCSENDSGLGDLSDQPLPASDNPPVSVKDCFRESSQHAPSDDQLPPAANEEHVCHDLELSELSELRANCSASTDQMGIKENKQRAQCILLEIEPLHDDNDNDDRNLGDKTTVPISNERSCSPDGMSVWDEVFSRPANDSIETRNQSKALINLSQNVHEDDNVSSVGGVQDNINNMIKKELSSTSSAQWEAVTRCESEEPLSTEAVKHEKTTMGLENISGRVVIPFIGVDISGDNVVQPVESHLDGKTEENQDDRETLIAKTSHLEPVLPTEKVTTPGTSNETAKVIARQISLPLPDVNESKWPEVSGSDSDRCPTPTMDEKPYHETSYGNTGVSGRSTFIKEEMVLEQGTKPMVNSNPFHHHGLRPDLEQRTLRVLQTLSTFLPHSDHANSSSLIEMSGVTPSLHQMKDLLQTTTELDCPQRSLASAEALQAFQPNTGQDEPKATLQNNPSPEPHSHSRHPVMAVRTTKSKEIQTGCISKDSPFANVAKSTFSKHKPTKTPKVTGTPTVSCKTNSAALNEVKQEATEISWPSNDSKKSKSNKATFDISGPSRQYEGRDIANFEKVPLSSLPLQPSQSAKSCSKHVAQDQSFLKNNVGEEFGQLSKESVEFNQTDSSHQDASTAALVDQGDGAIDDSFCLRPESSLSCTIFNTGPQVSETSLEKVSQRCQQDDLTRASVDQEHLIFAEHMRELLKRYKKGQMPRLEVPDKLSVPCSSPVTVHFSTLEEQEDSFDHSDTPSLIGQKFKVDMSDRKALTDTAEEGKPLHSPKGSQGSVNPPDHAGISGVTAECAREYTAMMNDVCAVTKVSSVVKHIRMERGEPSNHFDFCDKMKREMDESFRTNLNSVVKKSCKTKHRFYILATSDDAFFEETKVLLESEGHVAVQPSEFFLGEDTSSSLLIILRNEDIAEYICQVPDLLKLKMTPGVQFAGIDEPDDVLNLTHQELFVRGGFIMFDKTALESLSICNMKKMSEIVEELSRTGKWKWLLHYRDFRRLKENARLSAEAKEKKQFLNWCQEAGIMEVLPYHECDLTSRDQPDYVTCLGRLQVQNISARYPVFVTDTTESAFGTNGILTMTSSSILTCSPSETFTV
ncbi:uncharacterized protein V6R79_023782 [Siganus canaliculatus]